jgi:hypothetical protein
MEKWLLKQYHQELAILPCVRESTNGVWETSKLHGTVTILLFPVGMFTWFNYGLVETQGISIVQVPQIGESTSDVRQTSKLGEIKLISLFAIGVFTWFNCGLITTQDISIVRVPQIEESTSGVQETSKFGGTGLHQVQVYNKCPEFWLRN